MPNWANLMLTKQGKVLQAKAIAGSTLTITKMKLGSGIIPDGVSPEDLTDLIQPKQALGLTAISVNGGLAKIQSIVTNAELSEGYYIRECGVFANDPDVGEIMYAIMTDTSPDFLPSASSSVVISEEFSINVVTENMANITAIIDPEGIVTVANARKIAEDKVTEHNEDTEAHPNLKGITIGKGNVIATKKGDLLTLLAGKGINLLSDIKNKIITIVGKSKNAWNPNEKIIAGDIRYTEDGNGPSWAYLLCKTAGNTGTVEPTLEAIAGVVDNKAMTPLKTKEAIESLVPMQRLIDLIYPVGSIYMSVNSTSPADLFGGTWEAMPAGRVLLAQGTSEWGVEYQAGSTGGEHEHKLSVGEIPQFTPTGTLSSAALTGYQNFWSVTWNDGGPLGGASGIISQSTYDGTPGWVGASTGSQKPGRSSINASHAHKLTFESIGGGSAHNIMQPYLSVFMWKRTA